MLSWIRWNDEEREESFIKHSLAVNDLDKYLDLFAPPEVAEAVHHHGLSEPELPVDPSEFDEINSYLDSLDKVRSTTAAAVVQGPDDDWI